MQEGQDRDAAEKEALLRIGALFGDRMRAVVTGGAPTPPNVMAFVRAMCYANDIAFSESYGTTECGPVTVDGVLGFGSKFNNHRIRIIDRPDKGFVNDWEECCHHLPAHADMYAHIKSPKTGEVVVLTPTLTLGYYHDQAKQDEAFIDIEIKCGRWVLGADMCVCVCVCVCVTNVSKFGSVLLVLGVQLLRFVSARTNGYVHAQSVSRLYCARAARRQDVDRGWRCARALVPDRRHRHAAPQWLL